MAAQALKKNGSGQQSLQVRLALIIYQSCRVVKQRTSFPSFLNMHPLTGHTLSLQNFTNMEQNLQTKSLIFANPGLHL